jgi:RHS repeat-associated protein
MTGAYLSSNTSVFVDYFYDAQNKRIWSGTGAVDGNGNATNYTVNVYTPSGQKLAAYTIAPGVFGTSYTPALSMTVTSSDQYFGSRRVAAMDRLGSAGPNGGSVGTFYPWGEDQGTTNPQNIWSYATYWRDSISGLDYANNRYYSSSYGRFMTPDPRNGGHRLRKSAFARREKKRLTNPTNWNLYAYVSDDPVNNFDPNGTTCIPVNGVWANDGGGCGYVGDPVSSNGSFSFSGTTGTVTTTISFDCTPGSTGSDCSDTSIYGWLGLGGQVMQMVGQELNSVSAGGFTFAPLAEGSLGPAEGSVLVIKTYDSSTGSSTSVLAEVGVGDVAVGYEQNLTNGSSDTLVLGGLLPGNGSGVDLGLLGSAESGTFGFYFGVGDYGFGFDFSLGGGGGDDDLALEYAPEDE